MGQGRRLLVVEEHYSQILTLHIYLDAYEWCIQLERDADMLGIKGKFLNGLLVLRTPRRPVSVDRLHLVSISRI